MGESRGGDRWGQLACPCGGHMVRAGGGARGGPGGATRRCRRGKAARALHHHVRAFGVARTGAQRGDRAGRSSRGGRERESRTEERRVGKERVSRGILGWSTKHKKKNKKICIK